MNSEFFNNKLRVNYKWTKSKQWIMDEHPHECKGIVSWKVYNYGAITYHFWNVNPYNKDDA